MKSMIRDGIGQHKVLLSINGNYNKMCYILSFFKMHARYIESFLLEVKKNVI